MILKLLNESYTDFEQEHGTRPDYLLITARLNDQLQQELTQLSGSSPGCVADVHIIEADHANGIQYLKK
jgi:hypothetical protein